MPRHMDVGQRRRDIAGAAQEIFAESGPSGLTLRAIAAALGGSITLVTHIYPTRRDLIAGLAESLIEEFDAELPILEAGAAPAMRLRILLEWMLPLSEQAWMLERSRVLLIADADQDGLLDRMDSRMRELLRSHLDPVVSPQLVDSYVDMLRTLINGVVLSAVEHHEQWPAHRQLDVLHDVMRHLGLALD